MISDRDIDMVARGLVERFGNYAPARTAEGMSRSMLKS